MPERGLFRQSILALILIELLSLAAYFFPSAGLYIFALLSLAFALAALRSLPAALLVVFAELSIGSKGYLFAVQAGGLTVSIRLMLFLVLMSVWLAQAARKLAGAELSWRQARDLMRDRRLALAFSGLALFVVLAAANGLWRGQRFDFFFFDLNGWLFFGLAGPLLTLPWLCPEESARRFAKRLFTVLLAAVAWLSAKTVLLLYLFSHLGPWLNDIYRWVRQTGAGEITLMDGGFYRVFMQSQIFILAGILALMALAARPGQGSARRQFLLALCLAATVISLSRSNWLGLAAAGAVFFAGHAYGFFRPFRAWLNYWLRLAGVAILSLLLVFAAARLPWPRSAAGPVTLESIKERGANLEGEAGAASRWALWPVLAAAVKEAPLLGQGFGASVSYRSADPRVLAANPDGVYTTYAFEWGWLDIALKLGILGALCYAYILWRLAWRFAAKFRRGRDPRSLLGACLAVLLFSVNFFSPYLNHPLGIGLLLALVFYYNNDDYWLISNKNNHSSPPLAQALPNRQK